MKTDLKPQSRVCLLVILATIFVSLGLQAQTPIYNTAQAAVRVIGQPDYSSNIPGDANFQLGSPTNMLIIGKKLIVSDGGLPFLAPNGNRVLVYNDYTKVRFGAAADVVIGQTAFGAVCTTTVGSNLSCTDPNAGQAAPVAYGFFKPLGLATDGTKLIVADSGNNRVLIFNQVPASNGASADVVIGQSNFTNSTAGTTSTTFRTPGGVMVNAGKLYVVDQQNNRVLIYNTIPTANNAAADVVLGQTSLTTRVSPATPSASTMSDPFAVTTDGVHLFVTDLGNNRILIWNKLPTSNTTPADVEVGQVDFASFSVPTTGSNQLDFPRDAFSDGQRLIVSDGGNNRILVFNKIPTANNAFPDAIIGQYDSIGHLEGLAAEKLANPVGLLPLPTGGFLVADGNNRRLLEFDPGLLLVQKPNIYDAASLNGNGLSKPVNVTYTTQQSVSGAIVPAGTYYARVAALSAFPRTGKLSDEIQIVVPQDNSQLTVKWDPVALASGYIVFFGRIPLLEDRFASADLLNAAPSPLIIGGSPSPNDSVTVTITQDDATTFTFTYVVINGDTVGSIGDALAAGINASTSNTTHGVTATSNKMGTISFAAKETGSVGDLCAYLATEAGTAATQIFPNNVLTQFTGATDATNASQLTLLNYPDPPSIAGSFGPQRPQDGLVPGGLALITGTSLAPTTVAATTTPLPLQLAGTSVLVNSVACPLVSVSPTQIIFQVPAETSGTGGSVQVLTTINGQQVSAVAVAVTITLPEPSLYSADGTGVGGVLATHADGSMVTNANPASIGEAISFYGTGFGLLADYPTNVMPLVSATGGALIPAQYFIRVTAIFPNGRESLGDGEQIISATDGNSNLIQLTWDATPGAQKYRVYVGTRSLGYDRYFESDTNSFNVSSIFGAAGFPPVQTNFPGDGQIHVATTIDFQVQTVDCPITYSGPNPGVIGVIRVTCVVPTTIAASDLFLGPNDSFGAAEVHTIVGAIDSNHLYLSLKRPPPTGFTLTPPKLFFTAISGGSNPASQPLSVTKTGGGSLSWLATVTTTDGGAWLLTDTTSGSDSGNIAVSVDQTGLSPGTYTGTISVSGSDAAGNTITDASGNPLSLTTTITFVVTSTSNQPQRRKLGRQ